MGSIGAIVLTTHNETQTPVKRIGPKTPPPRHSLQLRRNYQPHPARIFLVVQRIQYLLV